MARHEHVKLDVPAATGAGKASHVGNWDNKWFLVSGTFAATYSIQGTLDGDKWFDIQIGISAPLAAPVAIDATIKQVRVNVTTWTSGAANIVVAGHDLHTH